MHLGAIPFIRLLLPLLLGIGLGIYFPGMVPIQWVLGLFLVLLPAWFLSQKRKSVRFSEISIGFIISLNLLLGFALAVLNNNALAKNGLGSAQVTGSRMLRVKVVEPLLERTGSWRAEAEVYAALDSQGKATSAKGKILLYWPKRSNASKPAVQYGDLLIIPNVLEPIQDAPFPGAFSYRNVLRPKQIGHQVYLTASSWNKTGKKVNGLRNWSFRAVEAINTLLEKRFKPEHAALMSSLLLGYKADISEQDLRAFSITGTIHVLAVSGMHVGLIYMALLLLFTGSIKQRKLRMWQGLAILAALWAYALLTGLSASVVRATLMFSIMELGRTFLASRGNTYNALFAAAYLQLLLSPFDLLDVGFQLSYLAVLGIVYFYPRLNALYNPPTLVLSRIWQLGLVSVAATLGTLPITLLVFKSFPLLFIPANIIIVPVSTVVIFMGIACLLLSPVPGVSDGLVWLTERGLDFLMMPARFMASIPGASFSGFSFDAWDTLIVFSIILAFGIAVYNQFYQRAFTVMCSLLMVFAVKKTADRWMDERSSELIVCEVHGKLLAAVKQGSDLHVLSEPMSFGRADTLRTLMKNYVAEQHIGAVHWHMAAASSDIKLKDGWVWKNTVGCSRLESRGKTLVSLLWLPDSTCSSGSASFAKSAFRRNLAGSKVQLLRSSYMTMSLQ
jgi:competence protein ComEC